MQGVMWNTEGGEVKNWATQRNLNYQAQLNSNFVVLESIMLPLWDCSVVKKRLQEVKFLTIVKTGHSVLLIIGRIGILLNIMVLIMVPRSSAKKIVLHSLIPVLSDGWLVKNRL